MSDKIIDRAPHKIEFEDYLQLCHLHKEFEWLEAGQRALFELWCLSETTEQKKLLDFLLRHFYVINSKELLKFGREAAIQIEEIWNLKPAETLIVATCDDDKPDGSQFIIQNLKNKFSDNWQEYNFINDLSKGIQRIKENQNIVLVDDFIGTGDTIKKKVEKTKSSLLKAKKQNISIRIVSLAAMQFSKPVLEALDSEYFCFKWLNKGISELVTPDEERNISISLMQELEDKLLEEYGKRKLENHRFGYKKSESLITIENSNIPNNVFPIFWWPYLKNGEKRTTLFKRI